MNEVKVGSPLTEFPGRTFNEIIRRIKRLEANQLPRRGGGGGGGSIHYVAITESFVGATWIGDEATDEEITVYPFTGKTISEDRTEVIRVGGEVVVNITAGKFKRAIVLGRDLMQVFCQEWTLPDGWGDT